ncbi:MAG: ATP-binding protein [Acidobacteriota bacterium]
MKAKTVKFKIADRWPLTVDGVGAKAIMALVANHTLIVGQSRSGKTNAARRIVEEVLLWTDARVVILDPNGDFRWLNTPAEKRDDRFARQWSAIGSIENVAEDGQSWGISWAKLTLEEMAAFLRLTPKENFAEYRHLRNHYSFEKEKHKRNLGTLKSFIDSEYLKIGEGEELERYRLQLLQLDNLKLFATDPSKDLESELTGDHRAVVIDLTTDDEQKRSIIAARSLEALWRDGEKRRRRFLSRKRKLRRDPWVGTVVLIDEGHLFAPTETETEDPQKRLVRQRVQRFADQGKKLNLYLIVITQQPGKLHRDVLSEFDNRIILRMNERLSLKVLEDTYGGLRGRYDGALTFTPGEALIEGALLSDENPPPSTPRGIRFEIARTREGGGTPQNEWASPKLV